jgi:hypothetical protein
MNKKDSEGSGRGVAEVLSRHLPRGTENEKHEKAPSDYNLGVPV